MGTKKRLFIDNDATLKKRLFVTNEATFANNSYFTSDVEINGDLVVNGGINTTDDMKSHLKKVDGVMIGRAAYHTPYLLADIER